VPENSGVAFSSIFLDKTPPVDVRIDEMLQWAKKLGSHDNLSFRTKMGFVINGSNISPESLTRDMVVEVRGVVFGLNRPSIYAKGQVMPAAETLLHSDIYEVLPEINAIFCVRAANILEAAVKLGLPATGIERPAGSAELAQEAATLMKSNKSAGIFILKNFGVVIIGVNLAEAGKAWEDLQQKNRSSAKPKSVKKK
jgi:ribulose-5-phosphate 4-epimerase/fuculose-1-phosphate aldolase